MRIPAEQLEEYFLLIIFIRRFRNHNWKHGYGSPVGASRVGQCLMALAPGLILEKNGKTAILPSWHRQMSFILCL